MTEQTTAAQEQGSKPADGKSELNDGLGLHTCKECGMQTEIAAYHPYAACLMFKACHDSETVQANLDSVMAHGMWLQQEQADTPLPLDAEIPTLEEMREILTPNVKLTGSR